MSDIAIVGIALWYPGATTLGEFWENILSKRQQFRRLPDSRLPLAQYGDRNPKAADKTYGTEAAVIDEFEFDWREWRIPKALFESTDIVHWLALDVAKRAIENSNLELSTLQGLRTSVVVGNTLTGEWTRANAMRTRWPFVERVLRETAAAQGGIVSEQIEELVAQAETAFKGAFPPVTEDTLAGALSNTIAGRICNMFDFKGGGYTVDGACSSSLLAVIQAARALKLGEIEAAVVGGVDISLDTFELVGFAKTGALSPDEMRVYDQDGNGFIPGEGCGFVVLLPLDKAKELGCHIYSVIKGWGLTSDGRGGLTAPSVGGQVQALTDAYRMAGYPLSEVAFVEGHGTGTKLGDQVELTAISEVIGDARANVGMTSVKSIIGHTKAAAGIAGLIKAAIAIDQRTVPPTAGVRSSHALLSESSQMYAVQKAERREGVMRAGVSAMGFGGINTHVTIESSDQHGADLVISDDAVCGQDDFEILVFGAKSLAQLRNEIAATIAEVKVLSRAELPDYACFRAERLRSGSQHRAFVVAASPKGAVSGLEKLLTIVESGKPGSEETKDFSIGYESASSLRVAWMFPGQGSQRARMHEILTERFPWARAQVSAWRQQHSFLLRDPAAKNTEIQQANIVAVSALWTTALTDVGAKTDFVFGHSLGELSALAAAGAYSFETLIELSACRGKILGSEKTATGMLFLASDVEQVQTLLNGSVVIANINSARQVVVSGLISELAQVEASAKARGIVCKMLPVSVGFHHPSLAAAGDQFLAAMEAFAITEPNSSWIGLPALAKSGDNWVRAYLQNQITASIDFVGLVRAATADIFIEIGPSAVLANLVKDAGHKAVAVGADALSWRGYKTALGYLHLAGQKLKWRRVWNHRFVRPYQQKAGFIASLLEKPLKIAAPAMIAPRVVAQPAEVVAAIDAPPRVAAIEAAKVETKGDTRQRVIALIAAATQFGTDTLSDQQRLLDDLNMDSIKVTDLSVRLAEEFKLPSAIELNGKMTIGDVVAVVDGTTAKPQVSTSPLFALQEIAVPAPARADMAAGKAEVVVVRDVWQAMEQIASHCGSDRPIVVIEEDLSLFGTQKSLDSLEPVARIGRDLSVRAFVLSAAQEHPRQRIRYVSVPSLEGLDSVLATEINQTETAVAYDEAWQRHIPTFAPVTLDANERVQVTGVTVVSGGAKGITDRCTREIIAQWQTPVALIGSSAPETVEGLADTLAYYARLGVKAKYYNCDITDAASVQNIVQAIKTDLGAPKQLIHGAGVNLPKKVTQLNIAELKSSGKELSIKLNGLDHFVAAIGVENLQAVIALTSVIGVIGMQGNSVYGFANDAVDRRLAKIYAQNSKVFVRSIAFSVWGEVGMGARLGADKALASAGIAAMAPEQAAAIAGALANSKTGARQIVVSSYIGVPASHRRPCGESEVTSDLKWQKIIPGVEAVAWVDLADQQYLRDHKYEGKLVLPTVIGLELMARVAAEVIELPRFIAIEDLELKRPILQGRVIVRAIAKGDKVSISIRPESAIDSSFEGILSAGSAVELGQGTAASFQEPLGINPKRDLYGSILFQGESFQNILEVASLESDDETAGTTAVRLTPGRGGFILGDPFRRDCLLQSAQLIIPRKQGLPVRVRRWVIDRQGESKRVDTAVIKVVDRRYRGQVTATDATGNVSEKLFDYDLQIAKIDSSLPNAMQLARDVFPHGTPVPRAPVSSLAGVSHLATEHYAKLDAVLGMQPIADLQGEKRIFAYRFIPDFKAFASPLKAIHFTQFVQWMGLARELSAAPVMAEIRRLTESGEFGQVTNCIKLQVHGDLDTADRVIEGRVWCSEFSQERTGRLHFEWSSFDVEKGRVKSLLAAAEMDFSWIRILGHGQVKLERMPEFYSEFVRSMLAKQKAAGSKFPRVEELAPLVAVQDGGRQNFQTTQLESNLVGNVYFSNYSIWLARALEHHFEKRCPGIHLESGEFVCASLNVQHLREAMPYESVGLEFAIKGVNEFGLEVEAAFYRGSEKLAAANINLVWTALDKGLRAIAPMPKRVFDSLINQDLSIAG